MLFVLLVAVWLLSLSGVLCVDVSTASTSTAAIPTAIPTSPAAATVPAAHKPTPTVAALAATAADSATAASPFRAGRPWARARAHSLLVMGGALCELPH